MPGRRQHAEGSLYQRKSDGRWIAVVHLGWTGGKRQRRVFTGTTPGAAVERRSRWLEARRDGFTMPKGRPPYVSEWMLHWLHVVAKRKVEPTTWETSYRQKVTDLICPYFEHVPLPGLSEEDIERWHAELEQRTGHTGKLLAPGTIGLAHRIFSAGIREAVRRGRRPRNPLSNVTPPRTRMREPDIPSAQDVTRILQRCRTWPNGARWILAITTGLRQGEALALEWRDARLSPPASVTVRQSAAWVHGERIVKPPKSQSSNRAVPLAGAAVAALRSLREDQAVRDLRGLVFTDDGQPVHPRDDWQDWQDLLADIGLPRCRVHDIRHGYATMLMEAGVDPRVVQAMLGHATGELLKRYQHVRPVMHEAVAGVIDSVLGMEATAVAENAVLRDGTRDYTAR